MSKTKGTKTSAKKEQKVKEEKQVEVKPESDAKAEPVPPKKENKVAVKKEEKQIWDIEIDPSKTYEFVTLKKKNNREIISKEEEAWCEKTNSIRKIRYVSTGESPFLDEQTDNSKTSSKDIVITKGKIYVRGTNKQLIRYLLARDANADKKTIKPENRNMTKYRLRDLDKEKVNSEKKFKDRIKAKNIIANASEEELVRFLKSRLGKSPLNDGTGKSLYEVAESLADKAPHIFINDFTNPAHKIKAKIIDELEKGTIIASNGEVRYKATGGVIFNYDKLKNAETEMCKFILTGSDKAKELEDLIINNS